MRVNAHLTGINTFITRVMAELTGVNSEITPLAQKDHANSCFKFLNLLEK